VAHRSIAVFPFCRFARRTSWPCTIDTSPEWERIRTIRRQKLGRRSRRFPCRCQREVTTLSLFWAPQVQVRTDDGKLSSARPSEGSAASRQSVLLVGRNRRIFPPFVQKLPILQSISSRAIKMYACSERSRSPMPPRFATAPVSTNTKTTPKLHRNYTTRRLFVCWASVGS